MTPRKEASYISVATAVALTIAAISGGITLGALANDVERLKEDQSEVKEIRKEVKKNTVALASLSATQTAMLKAQEKQDVKLDRILDKLDEH